MRNICSLTVLFFYGIIRGSVREADLSKEITGDPNEAENDVSGSPLSEKELEESLQVELEPLDLKDNPITKSGFFQGDIVLKSEEHLQIHKGDLNDQLSAVRNPHMTWPDGVIPYVISATYTSEERSIIARAIAEYHQKTCIRFVPRTTHADYIHILKGQGCNSIVGRGGGMQVVSLDNGCLHFGVILHELMHVAGFWHEQSRYDRDDYVTIYWANILPGLEFAFGKQSNTLTTELGLPYDYSSIMHYEPYAFSRNGFATIIPKKSGVTIGQGIGFSELDVKGLNLLYNCSEGGSTVATPKPEECVDELDNCNYWATSGYCTIRPDFMLDKCKKSCNACGEKPVGSCMDNEVQCSSWAARGECQRNPVYMKMQCRKSCNLCNSSCGDQNASCQGWAGRGECFGNPAYMHQYCRKACGIC